MDEKRGGAHTQIPNELLDDPAVDAYELKLYAVIRRRDWDGAGWEFSWLELMEVVGCSRGKLSYCLRALRERGAVRVEGATKRRQRFFALAHPQPSVVHEVNHGSSRGEPPPASVVHEVNHGSSPEKLPYEHIHRRSKTIDSSPLGDESPTRDASEEQAQGLCAALGIAASRTSLQAMARVVNDLAATSPRPLADLALDAASWLESHQRGGDVPFFRRWVEREITGLPDRQPNGEGRDRGDDGKHRGRARTDATAADAAAQRRDRVTDERLKRHLARGGTEKSFFGL